MKETWPTCPRCGSKRVQKTGALYFFLLGLVLVSLSIWLMIIPPVGIGLLIMGVSLMIASPMMRHYYHCKDCNKYFKFEKEELNRTDA